MGTFISESKRGAKAYDYSYISAPIGQPERLKNMARAKADTLKSEAAVSMSVHGNGWSWIEERVSERPWLFGSGGWQDGATAFIRTSQNIQKEEDLAMQHMGKRTVDQTILPRLIANSNLELNFAQFKTGKIPEGTQTNPSGDVGPGQTEIPMTTLNGLVGGDVGLKIDPRGHEMEHIAAAMGVIAQNIGNDKADPGIDNGTGLGVKSTSHNSTMNPFSGKPAKSLMEGTHMEEYSKAMILTPEEEEQVANQSGDFSGGKGGKSSNLPEYYRGDKLTDEEQNAYNEQLKTGLRRVNVTKRPIASEPKAFADQMQMYQTISELQDVQTQFLDGVTSEERQLTIEKARYSGSKYTSTNMGLVGLSRSQYKKSRAKRKKGVSKLGVTMLGH